MATRSRQVKSTFLDDLFNLLLLTPWWVGPILATAVFGLFHSVLPWWLLTSDSENQVIKMSAKIWGPILTMIAPYAAAIVLLVWMTAEYSKWSNRRRLDKQSGVESIRQLGWQEFERLLAEAFRREGYQVEQLGGPSPDGGVDLRLHRDGETTVVQCKQWRSAKVGVSVVRELKGVMATQGAHGIVVTSGRFTPDAMDFARNAGIRAIDGDTLAEMIRAVQRNPPAVQQTPKAQAQPEPASLAIPACPKCGAAMKIRTASQGPNAGAQFWGCSTYPRCKGIVNIVR